MVQERGVGVTMRSWVRDRPTKGATKFNILNEQVIEMQPPDDGNVDRNGMAWRRARDGNLGRVGYRGGMPKTRLESVETASGKG